MATAAAPVEAVPTLASGTELDPGPVAPTLDTPALVCDPTINALGGGATLGELALPAGDRAGRGPEVNRLMPLFPTYRSVGPTLPGALSGLSLRLSFEERNGPAAPAGNNPFCEKSGNGCLVARIAYGLYLGKVPQPRGQISLYLTPTRKRGLVTGVKTKSAPGGLGLRTTLFFAEAWGLHLEAKTGRGTFVGLGLVWRP